MTRSSHQLPLGFSFPDSWVFSILLLAMFCWMPQARAMTPAQGFATADFTDIAQQAGLTMINVFGGKFSSMYILESTGTGIAIFDYDNDGWPDIFLVNGTRLGALPNRQGPTNQLYHNNRDGTFTDVTIKAGLQTTGWGQG